MTHPTLKQTPKGYFEWLKREVNKEDWGRWARETSDNPLPKYEKTTLQLTKATAFSFSKYVTKYLLI